MLKNANKKYRILIEENFNEGVERMNLSKEQLELIGNAIDINYVKMLIQDNINEYNQFVIEEIELDYKDSNDYPRKDDTNGCSDLCTL